MTTIKLPYITPVRRWEWVTGEVGLCVDSRIDQAGGNEGPHPVEVNYMMPKMADDWKVAKMIDKRLHRWRGVWRLVPSGIEPLWRKGVRLVELSDEEFFEFYEEHCPKKERMNFRGTTIDQFFDHIRRDSGGELPDLDPER